MVIGSYKRIYQQDYSKQNQADIGNLAININNSFTTLYTALTNQLTFSDNINCTVTNFTITVDSNGKPITPVRIKLQPYQNIVNGIIAINATPNTNSTDLPTAGLFINYSINNNLSSSSTSSNTNNNSNNPLQIDINNVIGLPASKSFTIYILII